MVTPEMLLFLAERVYGASNAEADYDRSVDTAVIYAGLADEQYTRFNPAADDAQFGRLVVWAAMQGLEPMLAKRHAFAGLVGTSSDYTEGHNSTPDSIRAAAVVAICRAIGYEGGRNA